MTETQNGYLGATGVKSIVDSIGELAAEWHESLLTFTPCFTRAWYGKLSRALECCLNGKNRKNCRWKRLGKRQRKWKPSWVPPLDIPTIIITIITLITKWKEEEEEEEEEEKRDQRPRGAKRKRRRGRMKTIDHFSAC